MNLINNIFTAFFILALSFCSQAQKSQSESEKIPFQVLLEMELVNPIYISSNLNGSHHDRWSGYKVGFGLRIASKLDIIITYSKSKSKGSSAYFLESETSVYNAAIVGRYSLPFSKHFSVIPKIGVGTLIWHNSMEFSGTRYLTGVDLAITRIKDLDFKFNLDIGYDNYDARLPESINGSFNTFFIQPGLSALLYFGE